MVVNKGKVLLLLGVWCATAACTPFASFGKKKQPFAEEGPVITETVSPVTAKDRVTGGVTPIVPADTPAGGFNAEIVSLADQLERNLDQKLLDNSYIVTSFANLDKLSETTAFGRLVAENLVHELQVRRWHLFDVRLTKEVIINDSGEFSLSRDIGRIRDSYKVSGIVVGTYAVNRNSIVLNARVINLDSGLVVSAAQSYLPITGFLDNLLYNAPPEKSTMKIVGDPHAK